MLELLRMQYEDYVICAHYRLLMILSQRVSLNFSHSSISASMRRRFAAEHNRCLRYLTLFHSHFAALNKLSSILIVKQSLKNANCAFNFLHYRLIKHDAALHDFHLLYNQS